VDDSGLVVHKCRIVPVGTGGIMPCSEASELYFCKSRVSTGRSVNRWGILFRSLLVALEPGGVLVINGDGISGVFGGGGGC
jgi:hypothetical protein